MDEVYRTVKGAYSVVGYIAGHGMFALVEMVVFVTILVVGFVYEWKKGGLEWQ